MESIVQWGGGKKFKVYGRMAGAKGICPNCGTIGEIPRVPEEAVDLQSVGAEVASEAPPFAACVDLRCYH